MSGDCEQWIVALAVMFAGAGIIYLHGWLSGLKVLGFALSVAFTVVLVEHYFAQPGKLLYLIMMIVICIVVVCRRGN